MCMGRYGPGWHMVVTISCQCWCQLPSFALSEHLICWHMPCQAPWTLFTPRPCLRDLLCTGQVLGSSLSHCTTASASMENISAVEQEQRVMIPTLSHWTRTPHPALAPDFQEDFQAPGWGGSKKAIRPWQDLIWQANHCFPAATSSAQVGSVPSSSPLLHIHSMSWGAVVSPPVLTPEKPAPHPLPSLSPTRVADAWPWSTHPAVASQGWEGSGPGRDTKGLSRGSLLTLGNDLKQTERFCHPSR